MDVVERYLQAVVAHDWPGLAECLTEDVVRIGPFGDTYTPRDLYVAFLADLMPRLPGYAMDIGRVLHAGRCALVELSETVEVDGTPIVTPEALVFDLDDDGLIARVDFAK